MVHCHQVGSRSTRGLNCQLFMAATSVQRLRLDRGSKVGVVANCDTAPRDQPRNTTAVVFVGLAEMIHKVAFLELNRDEHVQSQYECEQQMSNSHGGRGPECD